VEDGMVMVYVPAGEFSMGSNNGEDDERPVHSVTLDAFWIDQTEVTNGMYAMCVDAGKCSPPSSIESQNRPSYYGNSAFAEYPVVHVSWNAATAYCAWAGGRLPTEAEWEKAARGTDGRIYPWGNQSPSGTLLNFNGNLDDTSRVGNYSAGASPYGALDMAGNVWEWVSDFYDKDYYRNSTKNNPPGALAGLSHVLRGGAYYQDMSGIRSTDRYMGAPTVAYSFIGFRCARTP
jgi:serine/threonine-protein kinase